MVEGPSDEDLLEQWREGDRRAGDLLLRRYFVSVRAYFANRAPEALEDLIQETFARMVSARDSFEGRSSFRTYLFCIARNVYCEFVRSRYRERGVFEPAVDSVADFSARRHSSLLAESERLRLLLDALRTVPSETQDLLELYYFEELKISELAEVFAVPSGTIKSRLSTARRRLADTFEALAGQPHGRGFDDDDLVEHLVSLRAAVRTGELAEEP